MIQIFTGISRFTQRLSADKKCLIVNDEYEGDFLVKSMGRFREIALRQCADYHAMGFALFAFSDGLILKHFPRSFSLSKTRDALRRFHSKEIFNSWEHEPVWKESNIPVLFDIICTCEGRRVNIAVAGDAYAMLGLQPAHGMQYTTQDALERNLDISKDDSGVYYVHIFLAVSALTFTEA